MAHLLHRQDPDGALNPTRTLWRALANKGVTTMDRTDDFLIQHVNVNVDDLDAAIPFYRDILGLALDHTPEQGFRSQFFKVGAVQQIHMNEMRDARQFRGHFCLVVQDFMEVFARAKAAKVIDVAPWGKVRQLPN